MKQELKEVEIIELNNGLKWPFYKNKKALSASYLTKILRNNEYANIPQYILLKAAKRGKIFHKIIQNFLENKKYPFFFDIKKINPLTELSKIENRLFKTIEFIENQKFIMEAKFIGSEKLKYIFYNNNLLATYIDIEFDNFIIELKTNSSSYRKNAVMILIFDLQLLIQYLCNKGKKIFILWNVEEGIFFEEFKFSDILLEILDFLISLTNKNELETESTEKIIEKIMKNYIPKIINFKK